MLISLLVVVIVLAIIFGIMQYVPLASPFREIILAVVAIIAIIYLIQKFL